MIQTMNMKAKYTLFRRSGVYYSQDTASGQQKSLRTKDEAEALKLISTRNDACRQPVLNLHLARAYLTASDPAFVERTWQTVMDQLQARGKDSSRERYQDVFKSPAFDGLCHKRLMETTTDDFLATRREGSGHRDGSTCRWNANRRLNRMVQPPFFRLAKSRLSRWSTF